MLVPLFAPGRWLLLSAVLVLPACSFAPPQALPETVEALPEVYEQADTLAPYEAEAWWTTYRDPVLDALVEGVLAQNLDLVEAAARVEQARAQYRIARAGLFPDLRADAQAQRQSQPANTGIGGQLGGRGEPSGGGPSGEPSPDTTGSAPGGVPGGPAASERFAFNTYSASLSFSYELDVWGRVRNGTDAAEERFAASVADLRTVEIGVIAQTMQTYFLLVALEQRLDLARTSVELLEQRLDLTELRYRRGLVGTFELYTIRQQYRQAQSSLPQLESQLYATEAQLAVLLGRYPDVVDELLAEADTLEVGLEMEPIPVGLPSTLLEQRPDVAAAFRRMEAARYEVGVARAARFPQFALTGQAGTQSSDLANLVSTEQWFTGFVASLTAPIFSGGRIRANIDAAEALYVQEAAAYARTVLTAFRDVETALKAHEETLERYRFLLDQLDDARASARLQLDRYRRGVADYLNFLDARRSLVDVQTAIVQTEQDLADARLAVHRALGGAWVDLDPENDTDTRPDDQP